MTRWKAPSTQEKQMLTADHARDVYFMFHHCPLKGFPSVSGVYSVLSSLAC